MTVPTVDPHEPHGSTAAELGRFNAARRSRGPLLTWRRNDGELEIHPLDEGAVHTIGRHPEASVCLYWDSRVSKLHAQLERVGGEWLLRDDGLSKNGTRLNGQVVTERRRLADGDRIRLGGCLIAFHAGEDDLRIPPTMEDRGGDQPPEFSGFDRQILVELCRTFVAHGLPTPVSNPEIAAALHLSLSTIKTHMGAMYTACGLTSTKDKRAELMRLVVGEGIVSPRDYVEPRPG